MSFNLTTRTVAAITACTCLALKSTMQYYSIRESVKKKRKKEKLEKRKKKKKKKEDTGEKKKIRAQLMSFNLTTRTVAAWRLKVPGTLCLFLIIFLIVLV